MGLVFMQLEIIAQKISDITASHGHFPLQYMNEFLKAV